MRPLETGIQSVAVFIPNLMAPVTKGVVTDGSALSAGRLGLKN